MKADSSAILELISENVAEEIQTQMKYSLSSATALSTFGRHWTGDSGNRASETFPKLQSQAKLKPKFAEFICTYAEVYLYVCAVTKSVIPDSLWGSKKNREVVFGREYFDTFQGSILIIVLRCQAIHLLPAK